MGILVFIWESKKEWSRTRECWVLPELNFVEGMNTEFCEAGSKKSPLFFDHRKSCWGFQLNLVRLFGVGITAQAALSSPFSQAKITD